MPALNQTKPKKVTEGTTNLELGTAELLEKNLDSHCICGKPFQVQLAFVAQEDTSSPTDSSTESSQKPAKSYEDTAKQWRHKKRDPEDYERDRMGKYTLYFQGDTILPILEIYRSLEPQIFSPVVSDLRTWRLAGIKRDIFEQLLKSAGVPYSCFCRSFATWDILLPTLEQATKFTRRNITTKFFWLQLEYMGTRCIHVTICNVLMELNRDVLTSFLRKHSQVEEVTQLTCSKGTTHRHYVLKMCLNHDGGSWVQEATLLPL